MYLQMPNNKAKLNYFLQSKIKFCKICTNFAGGRLLVILFSFINFLKNIFDNFLEFIKIIKHFFIHKISLDPKVSIFMNTYLHPSQCFFFCAILFARFFLLPKITERS